MTNQTKTQGLVVGLVLLMSAGCAARIPVASIKLNQMQGSQTKMLHQRHRAAIQGMIKERKAQVDYLFDQTYAPVFKKRAREQIRKRSLLKKEGIERQMYLAEGAQALQERLKMQREKFKAPLTKVESKLLAQIDKAYMQMLEINEAQLALLKSAKRNDEAAQAIFGMLPKEVKAPLVEIESVFQKIQDALEKKKG